MSDANEQHDPAVHGDGVEMPRPTAAPFVLAVGLALAVSGLVTSYFFCAAGGVLLLIGLVRWISQMVPGRGKMIEEFVPAPSRALPVAPSRKKVVQLKPGMPGHRVRVPEKIHPYSAGLKGGIAGGIAMAATAMLYGHLAHDSVWYPINLLAAMALPSFAEYSDQQLGEFHATAFVLATLIHITASLFLGFFFGAILPTLPRWPVFWGGVVGPILWTAAIYSFMNVLNPVMNARVDWKWFLVSQFAYGVVAGFVIQRSEKVYVGRKEPT